MLRPSDWDDRAEATGALVALFYSDYWRYVAVMLIRQGGYCMDNGLGSTVRSGQPRRWTRAAGF